MHNLLEGSVQRIGNRVRITAQLIDPDRQKQLWSDQYDGQIEDLEDLFNIQSTVATKVVNNLKVQLDQSKIKDWSNPPTQDLLAYEYYLRGNHAMQDFIYMGENRWVKLNKEVYERTLNNFEKAIALDSNLAEAYVGLARTYWERNVYANWEDPDYIDTVKIYCQKALSLDSTLSDAHALLGRYHFRVRDHDAFLHHLRIAQRLNPNSSYVHHSLGVFYSALSLTRRRPDYTRAIEYLHRAIRLDPFSASTISVYADLSWIYMELHAFDLAEQYANKAMTGGEQSVWANMVHLQFMKGEYEMALEIIRNSPDTSEVIVNRFLSEIETNYYQNYDRAIELYVRYEEEFNNTMNYKQRYGLAHWLAGNTEIGTEILQDALRQYVEYRDQYGISFCYDEAGVHATLGNLELAMEILRDRNCHFCCGLEYYATHDPLYQNLWEIEEFQEIIADRIAAKTEIRKSLLLLD